MNIKLSLDWFSTGSGLNINASKSMCFLSHVPPSHAAPILNCLGFQLGVFPANFFGCSSYHLKVKPC